MGESSASGSYTFKGGHGTADTTIDGWPYHHYLHEDTTKIVVLDTVVIEPFKCWDRTILT
jgi:hypothetical protein